MAKSDSAARRRAVRAKREAAALPVIDRRKDIGERLRQVRIARGLSQEDVAEACAVTRAAVSLWEQGRALAEMENLERAAQRLECSVEWLRTGAGTEPEILAQPMQHTRRALRFVSRPDVVAWSRRLDQPPFEGAVAEVTGGIGAGMPYKHDVEVFDWWRVPPGLLQERYRTKASALRIYRVLTDNMEPVIRRGSHVIVDIQSTVPQDNSIYAIDNGISVVLKRVVLRDGDDKMIGLTNGSDKELHRVPLKKLKIVGRCIVRIDDL